MLESIKDKFLHLGKNVECSDAVIFAAVDRTWIGDDVMIQTSVSLLQNNFGNTEEIERIKIGHRSFIGRHSILESFNKIVIEEDVLISPRAYISDAQHEYSNPLIPIIFQLFDSKNNVLTIKRGAWIGNGATLVGNITIGFGSVIGANALVTIDIPSHCVVIGNPARILKVYHYKKRCWVSPKDENEFIDILQERGTFSGYDNNVINQYIPRRIKEYECLKS